MKTTLRAPTLLLTVALLVGCGGDRHTSATVVTWLTQPSDQRTHFVGQQSHSGQWELVRNDNPRFEALALRAGLWETSEAASEETPTIVAGCFINPDGNWVYVFYLHTPWQLPAGTVTVTWQYGDNPENTETGWLSDGSVNTKLYPPTNLFNTQLTNPDFVDPQNPVLKVEIHSRDRTWVAMFPAAGDLNPHLDLTC